MDFFTGLPGVGVEGSDFVQRSETTWNFESSKRIFATEELLVPDIDEDVPAIPSKKEFSVEGLKETVGFTQTEFDTCCILVCTFNGAGINNKFWLRSLKSVSSSYTGNFEVAITDVCWGVLNNKTGCCFPALTLICIFWCAYIVMEVCCGWGTGATSCVASFRISSDIEWNALGVVAGDTFDENLSGMYDGDTCEEIFTGIHNGLEVEEETAEGIKGLE